MEEWLWGKTFFFFALFCFCFCFFFFLPLCQQKIKKKSKGNAGEIAKQNKKIIKAQLYQDKKGTENFNSEVTVPKRGKCVKKKGGKASHFFYFLHFEQTGGIFQVSSLFLSLSIKLVAVIVVVATLGKLDNRSTPTRVSEGAQSISVDTQEDK